MSRRKWDKGREIVESERLLAVLLGSQQVSEEVEIFVVALLFEHVRAVDESAFLMTSPVDAVWEKMMTTSLVRWRWMCS